MMVEANCGDDSWDIGGSGEVMGVNGSCWLGVSGGVGGDCIGGWTSKCVEVGSFDGLGVGAHGFVCRGSAHFSLNKTIVPDGAAVGVGVKAKRWRKWLWEHRKR